MVEMELYSGLSCAVPKAFGSALHGCRFEQGDVLYSDASAYDESKRGKRLTGYHIQVLDPPRSSRAMSGEGESQRFFANWESPARFEWMDYRGRERSGRAGALERLAGVGVRQQHRRCDYHRGAFAWVGVRNHHH